MIANIWGLLFGGNRNVLRETVEIFRENSESSARRESEARSAALAQFSTEFRQNSRGRFDQVMDGVNRLPRPMLALGACGLFAAAMGDPVWFSARMQGLTQVPEPLWWLLGVVVSFYFGARHQVKAHEFQRQMAVAAARLPQPKENVAPNPNETGQSVLAAATGTHAAQTLEVVEAEANPALEDWRALNTSE